MWLSVLSFLVCRNYISTFTVLSVVATVLSLHSVSARGYVAHVTRNEYEQKCHIVVLFIFSILVCFCLFVYCIMKLDGTSD